jgi:heme exporter protein B
LKTIQQDGASTNIQSTAAHASGAALFARHVFRITAKDLRLELRSKESLNASFAFAIVILLLFSFAFDPTAEQTREIAGGLLWLVFAFAGTLILNRSFARDLPNDCLDALLASPVSGPALYLGKVLANYVLLLVLELLCLFMFGLFYNVRWTAQLGPLLLVVALASWGLAIVGTLFSALTVNLRLRELMLPMLVYPIMIPELLGAIQLSIPLAVGQPLTPDLGIWMRLLVGFDVIYTALALALSETVLVG